MMSGVEREKGTRACGAKQEHHREEEYKKGWRCCACVCVERDEGVDRENERESEEIAKWRYIITLNVWYTPRGRGLTQWKVK